MLTERQRRVYEFLRDYVRREGVSPSYEEIRRVLGFRSHNSVYKHLKQLERKGYVRSPWGNRKRALEVVERGRPAPAIPLAGLVAAGRPIEAIEQRDLIEVPESFLGTGEHFALRVHGDSMVDDGIHDGDLIIVRKQETAENGQTAVVLVRGEAATVKRFYSRGPVVELRPSNPAMAPMEIRADEVAIQGVVIGLLRRYSKNGH